MEETFNNSPKRRYTTLWVMILLFGLPYVAAWYFYFNQDDINLAKQTNHGTLISPVKEIPELNLLTIENETFNTSSLKGRWSILTIGDTSCPQICKDNLYKLRQIRKALGQDRYRIQRLFLATDSSHLNTFNELIKDYEGTIVIVNTDERLNRLISVFKQPGINPVNGIYIIDPMGNYMMAYPENSDAKGILKDLTRLLKVSKIG